MSKKRDATFWGALVFMGVGVLMFLGGLYLFYDAVAFAQRAESAVGEVINVEQHTSRDSEGDLSITYTPTFRYTDATGQVREGAPSMSSSEYDYGIGEQEDILYDPDDPTDVRVDSFWSLYLMAIMLVIFGVVFGGAGYLVRRVFGSG